jgi:hypothetical protein
MAVSQVLDSVCADSEPQQAYVTLRRPLTDDAALYWWTVLVDLGCPHRTIVEQHFALSSET